MDFSGLRRAIFHDCYLYLVGNEYNMISWKPHFTSLSCDSCLFIFRCQSASLFSETQANNQKAISGRGIKDKAAFYATRRVEPHWLENRAPAKYIFEFCLLSLDGQTILRPYMVTFITEVFLPRRKCIETKGKTDLIFSGLIPRSSASFCLFFLVPKFRDGICFFWPRCIGVNTSWALPGGSLLREIHWGV